MTQEEKELLLKDLGARLQYKLHCRVFRLNGDIKENNDILYGIIGDNIITLKSNEDECLMYYQIKPYLRPMSSMTDEEKNDLLQLMGRGTDIERIDFYISHHFDYRGLMPIGLALEAPEDMYKI
jgi:hypothetical protein